MVPGLRGSWWYKVVLGTRGGGGTKAGVRLRVRGLAWLFQTKRGTGWGEVEGGDEGGGGEGGSD